MANAEENKQAAKAFIDAMGNIDIARMTELTSDDMEYWVGGSFPGSGTHTKAAVLGMIKPMNQFFVDGLRLTVAGEIAEGNRVSIEAAGGGTTVTGKKYDNRYHYVFEFDGAGKIRRLREYMDTGHAAEIFAS